jgi:hypothetical protein
MSRRDWIVHVKTLTFIPMLMYTIHDVTITPAAPDSAALSGHVQMMIQDNGTMQDMRSIPARIAEQAGPETPESAKPVAPAQEDSAHPQENNKDKKEPASPEHDDMGDPTELLTKGEEERRRESGAQAAALGRARNEELDALLDKQQAKQDDRAEKMAKAREVVEKRYADAPESVQKENLKKFDQMKEDDAKKLSDEHEAEREQFRAEWEQKIQRYEKVPLIEPTIPERDRDDDDDR